MRLTAIASEIREIPRNSLKIQTYGVQGHPRSLILVFKIQRFLALSVYISKTVADTAKVTISD